jgi:hypothetical protein
MKRTITIQFAVDTEEYNSIKDTEAGAVDLALMMLVGEADMPENATISCGDAKKSGNLNVLFCEIEFQDNDLPSYWDKG